MGFLSNIFGNSNKKKEADASAIPVLPTEIYEAAKLNIQDVIAPSAIEIESKQLKIGGKITRSYFTMSYPRFLNDGWLAPIINLDKIFDISIHINPIPTSDILKKFQKKTAEVQSQIREREKKGLVRDPLLDTAFQDLERLRDGLQQAQEKVFNVG